MHIKLNEFRLESYEERSAVQTALRLLRHHHPDDDKAAVAALLIRLSRTECQEGGCEYCNAERAREMDEIRSSWDE